MTDWYKVPTRQEFCDSLMQLDLHNGWNFEVEYGVFMEENEEVDVFYTTFFKNGLEIFTLSDEDGVSDDFKNTSTVTPDEALLIIKYREAINGYESLDDNDIKENRDNDWFSIKICRIHSISSICLGAILIFK